MSDISVSSDFQGFCNNLKISDLSKMIKTNVNKLANQTLKIIIDGFLEFKDALIEIIVVGIN